MQVTQLTAINIKNIFLYNQRELRSPLHNYSGSIREKLVKLNAHQADASTKSNFSISL
jgi:hypothetical protein